MESDISLVVSEQGKVRKKTQHSLTQYCFKLYVYVFLFTYI